MLTGWSLAGLKIIYQEKNEFGNTFEAIKGFCFAISITGLNRPNTRKDDDNDNDVYQRWGMDSKYQNTIVKNGMDITVEQFKVYTCK
jgi:hypothetical protein